MKKIVFIDQYGSLGGGQQVLVELIQAALTLPCDVAALIPAGSCADKIASMGVHVEHIHECRLNNGKKSFTDALRFIGNGLRVFFQQRNILKRADIIYVNGNRLMPVALLCMFFWAKKAVFHIHLDHSKLEKTIFSYVIKFKYTAAIIAPSVFIRDRLRQLSPFFKNAKLRLVENGLDSRFSHVPFQDRFSGTTIRHVGIVGRISPEKGQDVLPDLARTFPQLTFHILGNAAFSNKSYEQQLQAATPANVIFHGWVDDLPEKINEIGLQLCLVPSRCMEAAPLVPLQLLAMGCLVAVRSLGSLADIAKQLSLPSFHADQEIPACLQALLQTPPAQLAQQSRQNYTAVMAQYNHAAFQQRLRTLLAEVCNVEAASTL